ncbi:hypothetical protein [Xylanibacter ruminicola]|uniref:Uncharacterized protein n=1 Tax=Xylanibacter ruminicola TaxID=839 RepID=A0A1M6UDU2_XYLRU|nr:hypothetical protein [Xylanibacter ruminicola]SHK67340.1 hypothetical protein SAMN05216463_1096 [Xylanibacter ruminicola]
MTDYDYIIQQLRKCHFTGWNDEVLRDCVDRLPNLSRQELAALSLSKWTKDYRVFREAIFNILFAEKIGLREERIKNLETAALIEEFKDKKSGNVSLIRNEMQSRYKEGRDCEIIAEAFNASNEKDQQWVKSQERHSE